MVVAKVRVPKSLQGKVVGMHGATVKDIESDCPGVKLIVPPRHDPSEFVEIHGDEKAVHRALERVKDIVGFRSAKDEEEFARIDHLRAAVDDLFRKADDAAAKGNKRLRSKLLDEAHAKRRVLEQTRQEYARRVFERKNSGYALDQIIYRPVCPRSCWCAAAASCGCYRQTHTQGGCHHRKGKSFC